MMSQLRFYISELVAEAAAIDELGRDFFDASGTAALARLIGDLEALRAVGTDTERDLELSNLRTTPSRDYERGPRTGGRHICASVTGKWTLRVLGQPNRPKREVAFVGKASAKVTLRHKSPEGGEDQSEPKAVWRIEVGAHDSPGCFFHIQVPWHRLRRLEDGEEGPPPQEIPIPRFPSLFVTPMAAVEFVLCELFQDAWAEGVSRSTHHANRWRSIQKKRLQQLLRWQTDGIRNTTQSPWTTIKQGKPGSDLFLGD